MSTLSPENALICKEFVPKWMLRDFNRKEMKGVRGR